MPNYPTLIPKSSLQGTDIQHEGNGWLRQGPRADAWATPKARWAVQARWQGGRDSREAEVLVSTERANSKKRYRPERCEFPALPFLCQRQVEMSYSLPSRNVLFLAK